MRESCFKCGHKEVYPWQTQSNVKHVGNVLQTRPRKCIRKKNTQRHEPHFETYNRNFRKTTGILKSEKKETKDENILFQRPTLTKDTPMKKNASQMRRFHVELLGDASIEGCEDVGAAIVMAL